MTSLVRTIADISMKLRTLPCLIAGAMLLIGMAAPAPAQSYDRVFLIEVSGAIGVATPASLAAVYRSSDDGGDSRARRRNSRSLAHRTGLKPRPSTMWWR